MIEARFVHTNLIAHDWRGLARFYEQVFGCTPVPPERELKGERLEAATGVPGAQIEGVHLRLPGYGQAGPTLEIYAYHPQAERLATAVNRPGLAHIAFAVGDVEAAREAVLVGRGQYRRTDRIVAGARRRHGQVRLCDRSRRERRRATALV